MDSADWYDKIDDYLAGILAASEKEDMEAAIAQDEALARRVGIYRKEREALDILSAEKARADFMRWTEDTAKTPAPESWWKRHIWPLSAFGVLLLGLCILILEYQKPSTPAKTPISEPASPPTPSSPDTATDIATSPKAGEKLPPAPSTPLQIRPIERPKAYATMMEDKAKKEFSEPEGARSRIRGSGGYEGSFSEALIAYESAKSEADYARAGELFDRIEPNPNNYWSSVYFKGHAYFKSRQYEKAADAFRDYAAKGLPYAQDAKWKEALSLLATGEKHSPRLRGLLGEISDPEKQQRAKEILSTRE